MLNKAINIRALVVVISSLGLLAVNPAAAAAKWVAVKSTSEETIYVDANSIRIRGPLRDVWVKFVENVTDPRRVAVGITRFRFDCTKRRMMMLYNGGYLRNGTLVDAAGIPESQRYWDDIGPAGEAVAPMKFACARK